MKNDDVLNYWNDDNVESMYDKHLLNGEIQIIKSWLKPDSKILDAGCGEGEGTLEYSKLNGAVIHAADFSDTRLKKAAERLKGCNNISFKKVDFMKEYKLDNDYDFIVSQRFLINIMDFGTQKKVIDDFMQMLKPGGRFLMLEGSVDGVNELNEFRKLMGLEAIPVKWHNLFFNDKELEKHMASKNVKLIEKNGLGTYLLLTRGLRPYFDKELGWDNNFNRIAAQKETKEMLGYDTKFSRLRLWVFEKN